MEGERYAHGSRLHRPAMKWLQTMFTRGSWGIDFGCELTEIDCEVDEVVCELDEIDCEVDEVGCELDEVDLTTC